MVRQSKFFQLECSISNNAASILNGCCISNICPQLLILLNNEKKSLKHFLVVLYIHLIHYWLNNNDGYGMEMEIFKSVIREMKLYSKLQKTTMYKNNLFFFYKPITHKFVQKSFLTTFFYNKKKTTHMHQKHPPRSPKSLHLTCHV